MAEPTVSGQVAQEYAEKYPTLSTKKLAELLVLKEPLIFPVFERARSAVRFIRGLHPGGSNKYVLADRLVKKREVPPAVPSRHTTAQLPDDVKRYVVLSDIHVPFHDRKAVKVAIAKAKAMECDGVLLLGDIADCYSMSHFLRDPRLRKPSKEVQAIRMLLGAIKDELNPKRFIWKAGNHEDRLITYMIQHAPDFFDMAPELCSWRTIIGLEQMGIDYMDSHEFLRHGRLNIVHGHEWRGGLISPVNPARGAYLKTHECTLLGHAHQTSGHTESTMRGAAVSCWSIGCLCDLHPEYSKVNKWNHGFAVLHTGRDWHIDNFKVIGSDVL